MSYVSLMLDVLVLGALAYSIWFSLRLSRQFEKMQADRHAFEQLISALNLAAAKSESAVRAIREMAVASGEALQEKVKKAHGLAEELDIMIQAGDSLAERLQHLAEKSRKAVQNIPDDEPTGEPAAASARNNPTAGMQPRSKAERDLLEALKAKQGGGSST